jgi:hypothetical protein
VLAKAQFRKQLLMFQYETARQLAIRLRALAAKSDEQLQAESLEWLRPAAIEAEQRKADVREARLARRRARRRELVSPPRAADGFASWKAAEERIVRERDALSG